MKRKNCHKKPRAPDDTRSHARRTPILAFMCLAALLLSGCRKDADAIRALGGRSEPCTVDTYYLRATFPCAENDTLKAIAGLEDVVELDLTGSSISDEGLSHLEGMKNLGTLNLTRTPITDKGMAHLKDLGHARLDPPCTMELILNWTAVTDDGVKTLAAMENLGGLSLNGTHITDLSLRYLRGTKPLTGLDLDKTEITDAGLSLLAGSELRVLSLRHTSISDKGLGCLHSIKDLYWIDLTGTRVTAEGIKDLKRAIPGIQVECDHQSVVR